MTDSTKAQILEVARRAVHTEMLALKHMEETLGDSFAAAVELILASRGKCIVTGMGKSGLVGRKIAATLASTGTPSFFLHPGEAFHGDLGMISKEDIVLALSYSGETDEILKIVPFIHSNGNRLISMTGHPDSALAKNSDVHLDVGVREEACILHLAPTSSTTAQIAMGDALAVSLMQQRGFTSVDFARLHPGGSLGRRLLMTVGNVMRDHDLPVVAPDCSAVEMIHTISKGGLGLIVICDGDRIEGIEQLDKVVNIDQSPIGRTPRSNPATYTGLFNDIRDLFASTQEAKSRGYGQGRFSFNVRGGRCEACSGDGLLKIEMHFLPDIFVPCEVCKGRRYNRETLEVRYKGKNIADVLDMTVDEALDFFSALPKLKKRLQTLQDVGLGYVKLGQPSTELSGGEAQRVKLATELSKQATGKTIYILDEPTTGLHSDDVRKLLDVLQRLTDAVKGLQRRFAFPALNGAQMRPADPGETAHDLLRQPALLPQPLQHAANHFCIQHRPCSLHCFCFQCREKFCRL